MSYESDLEWPFFEDRHRALAHELRLWCGANVLERDAQDVDSFCRELVRKLGAAGWLRYAIGGRQYGGLQDTIDSRSLCLLRETLARHSGLADFAFAMQGLGSGAITLRGTEAQ